ncbi:calcium-binding protein [Rhizobium alvei]|uniref:Calcium-binding protein n=1 Tax=Rhizobium alvei TaxID=1132659 RepID=A0ABT8YIW9_9HYPH|nr:calcium-binding protein [Rhizobium alvei]MDO6963643.1 calcium-binding protein [Rhizobium alvei]
MVYMPTSNETGTGIRKTLADNEDVFIARNILVASTDNYGIFGGGSYNFINIQGTLAAALVALRVGGEPFLSSRNHLIVGRDGYIGSLGNSAAVEMSSYDSRIENRGEISGRNFGITVNGTNDNSQTVILNKGVISGPEIAVYRVGDEDFLLRNHGEIIAREESSAFYSLSMSNDTIKNAGEITGCIYLGEGNDVYDGRYGELFGKLNGGNGNDRLMTGAGDDQISGDLGNDTIMGGAGEDEFYFVTSLDPRRNVDRILDFNPTDDQFELGARVFEGLALGRLATGAFTANKQGLALDADDRIIYETDTGRLLFDADGKGGEGARLFAIVSKDLVLTNRDFEIFPQTVDFAKSAPEDAGWF